MNLTRTQLIIIGSVIFIIFITVGIFTGFLPGTRDLRQKPPELKLIIWGVDDKILYTENLINYETLRPNVKVDYEEINPLTYEQDIINALAAGGGPDIIMFHNTWLPKHFNKIIPIEETLLDLKLLQEAFPTVIEQDFAPGGQIFALPLYIDTLALLYNQDILYRNLFINCIYFTILH